MDHKLLENLNRQSKEAALRARQPLRVFDPQASLNPDLDWMPSSISHLYYAPFYTEFTDQERRTYNHLFTLTSLQQFIFFEARVSPRLLPDHFGRGKLNFSDTEKASLQIFDEEEKEHVRMFEAFLEKAKKYYPEAQLFRESPWVDRVLDMIFAWPQTFIFWCWAITYIEERTTILSRRMIQQEAMMDPISLEVHKRHLTDEMRHLVLVEELLKTSWDPAPRFLKKINVWILGRFMNYAFYKSFSARSTWNQLKKLHPRLEQFEPQFNLYLKGLPQNTNYLNQLFSEQSCPRFWESLKRRPETQSFQQDLKHRSGLLL